MELVYIEIVFVYMYMIVFAISFYICKWPKANILPIANKLKLKLFIFIWDIVYCKKSSTVVNSHMKNIVIFVLNLILQLFIYYDLKLAIVFKTYIHSKLHHPFT